MADSSPTDGELFKAKTVTDDEVNAAVDAYHADPASTAHLIADGYSLDLAAAVAGHRWASEVIASPEATSALRRAATRTAILLARVQKA
jgi:S-adenosylhomocysteine hydrolase